MRIAIVPTGPGLLLPAQKSHSIARVIEAQITGLLELGHEVIVLAPGDSRVDCEMISICEQHIPLIDDPGLVKTRRIQERILNILEQLTSRIDIVNAHSIDLDIPELFCTTGFLKNLDFPNVTSMHTSIRIENIDFFYDVTNTIIALSDSQRQAFPSLNYVGTVHNGLDPTPFPFVNTPENYFCFLGRINQFKQPHLAIVLAIKLGVPLKFAGPIESYNQAYFDHACKPYLNHPLIEYLGELDMAEKIDLISKARCNLHPTGFRDSFPLSPLEAAYCGTPTLAIRRGGLAEIIEQGKTGLLVEDFAEGYHHMQTCYAMDRRYISTRTRTLFNHRVMAEQYIKVYKEVIERFSQR